MKEDYFVGTAKIDRVGFEYSLNGNSRQTKDGVNGARCAIYKKLR
jgi:hypothetical protein